MVVVCSYPCDLYLVHDVHVAEFFASNKVKHLQSFVAKIHWFCLNLNLYLDHNQPLHSFPELCCAFNIAVWWYCKLLCSFTFFGFERSWKAFFTNIQLFLTSGSSRRTQMLYHLPFRFGLYTCQEYWSSQIFLYDRINVLLLLVYDLVIKVSASKLFFDSTRYWYFSSLFKLCTWCLSFSEDFDIN